MEKIKNVVNKYYHFVFIGLILFFRGFYLLNGWGLGHMAADSNSYLDADLSISALGGRVPLYPLFLKVCRRMVRWDESMACAVAGILQHILSLLVLILLYRVLLTVTHIRLLAWITVLFYGCNVALLNWDSAVMSESLAIDLVIVFIYVTVRYLKSRSALWGCLCVLVSVAAAMTKPTCAVLTGVCIVLAAIQFFRFKRMRKTVIKVSVAILLAILFYMAYCANTYRNYGVFNLTRLGPRHNLVTVLVTRSYLNYPDKELVEKIDAIVKADEAAGINIRRYPTTNKVMDLFGDSVKEKNLALSKFNKYCAKSARWDHFMFHINNITDYWDTPYENTDWKLWDYAIEYSSFERGVYWIMKNIFSSMHIWFSFLMLAVTLIMSIYTLIRDKDVPWYWLGMWGSMTVLLYAVYKNAYASFYRHTLFVLPFVYISVAMLLSVGVRIIIKKYLKKQKNDRVNSYKNKQRS